MAELEGFIGSTHGVFAASSRVLRGRWLALLLMSGAAGCKMADATDAPPVARETQPLILDDRDYVVNVGAAERFSLATNGQVAPIVVASEEHAGVIRVAGLLQADVQRVTSVTPVLMKGQRPASGVCVVVGTLGKSPLVDQLVAAGKLDVSDVTGKWEASVIQIVEQPWPGVARALVIVGSDKRGTIYGMFDLSEHIGVSPWYYWADVPVVARSELHVSSGRRLLGPPAVKYRGIFINDEAPALSGWASAQFGGFNSKFYEKLFELMLRLRANYLWPAMWGKSFNVDDAVSPQLADEYGIVMGTSHHEPMMRNQQEWTSTGKGAWNYSTNKAILDTFWEGGVRRMGQRESIVTIGMRGDGDTAMSPNPDIPLAQAIISAQRGILTNVTGKDPSQIPQVWTLYKEVQDYYDQGLRAPDDVTTMLCDDNWGNIRKLPVLGEAVPSGGFGVYYHFDYVGSPRNYKWLNTNLIPRVWEQMHLAYEYGVDRIWIVNVGDLKLLEFPTQFFLDYAWAPETMSAQRLTDYTTQFAARQFGVESAASIADILTKYSKYNARRKPELLAPETYSLVNYREAERIVADYNRLADEADAIGLALPPQYRAAYDQLVWFPVKASANLNELYVTVAMNRLYAKQGRASTNSLADRAARLFARDGELTSYYNKTMASGKWNHIADQTHIGYTTWQEPSQNALPAVTRITVPVAAEMGLTVEGSESFWPGAATAATLPEFSPYQLQPAEYIEVYNRGQSPFEYRVESGASYVVATPAQGSVETEKRIWLEVDWTNAPAGLTQIPVSVYGPNASRIDVTVPVNKPAELPAVGTRLVETNGYVAMEADQFSRKVEVEPIRWQVIPDLSRTGNGMTPFPVTASTQTPSAGSPRLEYDVHLWKSGTVRVRVNLSPTGQFVKTGRKYAVSFDEQTPQVVNMHGDSSDATWQERVSNNTNSTATTHILAAAGSHVLKFWMVDPGIVLQKIVIEAGTVRPSYLGPPTTRFEEPRLEVNSIVGAAGSAGAALSLAGAAAAEQAGAMGGDTLGGTGGQHSTDASATGGRRPNSSRDPGYELSGAGCSLSVRRSNAWAVIFGLTLVWLGRSRRRGKSR